MNHRALFLTLPALLVAACDPDARSSTLRSPPEPVVVAQASPAGSSGGYTSKSGKRYHHQCKKGESCSVTVTVNSCAPDGSGIALDFGDLAIEPGNQDVDITWTIKTKGYKFASTGIQFKTPNKEFVRPQPNGATFSWHDLNNMGSPVERPYPYTVTIVHDDGSACASKDPTVVNDA